ncbi:hypothetical protein STEG23_027769, partial [Scotinomys teguina]
CRALLPRMCSGTVMSRPSRCSSAQRSPADAAVLFCVAATLFSPLGAVGL